MKGHCACSATGMSSHAIARAFGHCTSGGKDHPWDPADLKRCVEYCADRGISTKRLAEVMAPVSPTWTALVNEWDDLAALLVEEIAEKTGRAPRTYARMTAVYWTCCSCTLVGDRDAPERLARMRERVAS